MKIFNTGWGNVWSGFTRPQPAKKVNKMNSSAGSNNQKKKYTPGVEVRIDSKDMTEKEKMDRGFNGKTYTKNGIEYDF